MILDISFLKLSAMTVLGAATVVVVITVLCWVVVKNMYSRLAEQMGQFEYYIVSIPDI